MPTTIPIDYRIFFKESPGALFECACDESWTILKASNAFYSILGFDKDSFNSIMGDSFISLLPKTGRQEFLDTFTQYMDRHIEKPDTEPLFSKLYLRRHDRKFQPVQLLLRLIDDGHRRLSCVYMPCFDEREPIEIKDESMPSQHIDSKLKERANSSQNAAKSFSGKNILLAEDHPLNVQMLTKMLERHGMNVHVAGNGRKAVEMFEQEKTGHYSAILMDVQMPLLNGLEAATKIRGVEKSRRIKKNIPIIAMYSSADHEYRNGEYPDCFTGSLSKPITFPKLMDMMSARQ